MEPVLFGWIDAQVWSGHSRPRQIDDLMVWQYYYWPPNQISSTYPWFIAAWVFLRFVRWQYLPWRHTRRQKHRWLPDQLDCSTLSVRDLEKEKRSCIVEIPCAQFFGYIAWWWLQNGKMQNFGSEQIFSLVLKNILIFVAVVHNIGFFCATIVVGKFRQNH